MAIFGAAGLVILWMPPTAAADFETERAEEDGSEMAGPVRTSLSNRQPYSA